MYRHALRGLSLSSSFLGTSCFVAAAASSPYPSFFSEFLWTTMCNSVEHSASGTFHCLAAARTSISLAVAPASRKGTKKLTTECEPSVSWSPYFSSPVACTTFTRDEKYGDQDTDGSHSVVSFFVP